MRGASLRPVPLLSECPGALFTKRRKAFNIHTSHALSRKKLAVVAASSNNQFEHQARKFAKDAKTKLENFAEEQQLKAKADQAAKAAKETLQDAYSQISDSARRKYIQLDSEYQFTERAAKAGRRVEEVVRDVDQQYSVKRRLRSWKEYIGKKWPLWNQQFQAFAKTWYGRVVVLAVLVLLLASPFFWKIVNIAVLLSWLAIPVSMVMLQSARKRQVEQMQAEQERLHRQQQSPFADIFYGRASNPKPSAGRTAHGPIIDAEYTVIDDARKRR